MDPIGPVVAPLCWAVLTIRMEARNQPVEGQIAIGNVIRNRMASRYFSDGSVAGTVLNPLQFSCWNAVDPQRVKGCQGAWDAPAIVAALQAWQRSKTEQMVADAVLYHSRFIQVPEWAKSPKVAFLKQIQDHLFYRVK